MYFRHAAADADTSLSRAAILFSAGYFSRYEHFS
jgi:hypothetical protein